MTDMNKDSSIDLKELSCDREVGDQWQTNRLIEDEKKNIFLTNDYYC